MAERMNSPSLSSPARSRSSLARPDWPWVASSSSFPSMLRNSHRNSQSSLSSTPTSSVSGHTASQNNPGTWASSNLQGDNWRSSTPRHSSLNIYQTPPQEALNSRQWTFIGFEWVIRHVHKLRDFVEGVPTPDNLDAGESSDASQSVISETEDFEILRVSPILGDLKFKLEISKTPPEEQAIEHASNEPQTLSLFITPLTMDFGHSDYELSTVMMAAIKCQDDRRGERGARPEWVWENWEDFVFRQENEVWTCPLPSLSALLENSRIRETDSMVISIQVHTPYGPVFPSQPTGYYVPKDLLDGLEASLDNPNTGDVRFICLERFHADPQGSPLLPPSGAASPTSHRSPSSTSSLSPFSGYTTARKRVIYAHSDILSRRSEYFATMLASSFAENSQKPGERKSCTIVVEEADFETIYWLLKFCYANWLLFKENDDPKLAVEGIGVGWSVKWLKSRGGEWDWKTFSTQSHMDGDARSAASGDSGPSVTERSLSPSSAKPKSTGIPSATNTGSTSRSLTSNTTTRATPSTIAKAAPASISPRQGTSSLPSPRRTTSGTVPIAAISGAKPSAVPLSTYAQRQRPPSAINTPDPHPHPTPPPPAASALSMYHTAHRYDMPALSCLALEHIMNTITPQSSFALLLASSPWEELRAL